MILCVTLNPCLDKTLTIPHWRPGDLVRGSGGARWSEARATTSPGCWRGWDENPPRHFSWGFRRLSMRVFAQNGEGLDPLVVRTECRPG